jgi:hypothetical protein
MLSATVAASLATAQHRLHYSATVYRRNCAHAVSGHSVYVQIITTTTKVRPMLVTINSAIVPPEHPASARSCKACPTDRPYPSQAPDLNTTNSGTASIQWAYTKL